MLLNRMIFYILTDIVIVHLLREYILYLNRYCYCSLIPEKLVDDGPILKWKADPSDPYICKICNSPPSRNLAFSSISS